MKTRNLYPVFFISIFALFIILICKFYYIKVKVNITRYETSEIVISADNIAYARIVEICPSTQECSQFVKMFISIYFKNKTQKNISYYPLKIYITGFGEYHAYVYDSDTQKRFNIESSAQLPPYDTERVDFYIYVKIDEFSESERIGCMVFTDIVNLSENLKIEVY